MISVAEAQALCLGLARPQGRAEDVPLTLAIGRILCAPAHADRAQPPFAAAAMDGYVVQDDAVRPGATFEVIGEAAAGHFREGRVGAGQAVRIFTGAPVPEGASHVVIQEDVARDGDRITLLPSLGRGPNIRPQGADFERDFKLLPPRILSAADLALLAAMNVATVRVAARPIVALLATGDELVMPGARPRPDQIIASNVFALKAMIDAAGGDARILPIAADTEAALSRAIAGMGDADLQITIGGASVGDHDLIGRVSQAMGLHRAFHKIAMRPGKPLIAGHYASGEPFVGLPGNPVSAIVCGHLFVLPMVRRMLGLADVLPRPLTATLTQPLGLNGPRAHYMRARFSEGTDRREVMPCDRQDSSLLTVLAEANCLLVRPPGDGPRTPGERVGILPI